MTDGITHVVANVGPYYGVTHLHAIALAARIPTCRVFVGGGYAKRGAYEPTTAIDYLNALGFTITAEVTEERATARMAFVAVRETESS